MELITENKCFGGKQQRYKHFSEKNQCEMTFSIYLPSKASEQQVPVLYWLSGLTCTDENFVTKAGAQQYAEKFGIAIVCPDTSPRGDDIPDDENKAYDFGLGAGFYVNATQAPWDKHYQMYSYVLHELPTLIEQYFSTLTNVKSISGHSMGGHGALVLGLRNIKEYKSISAFSPICSPMNCSWGEKALTGYLGKDKSEWHSYDASTLLSTLNENPVAKNQETNDVSIDYPSILIDQGTEDNFLKEQLKPELLTSAAEISNVPCNLRYQEGYDHSYFFISSFIEDHICFHAKHLYAAMNQTNNR